LPPEMAGILFGFDRATYAPRPIMPRPEAVRWRARKVGLDPEFAFKGGREERTTNRSAAVGVEGDREDA